MKPQVYFISDQTGLTVEALGRSLLSQFEEIDFEYFSLPFINTEEKANAAVAEINDKATNGTAQPIVFSTIVDKEIRAIFDNCRARFYDIYQHFLSSLERDLKHKAKDQSGLMHGVSDYSKYMTRIEAINFTLNHDDGMLTDQYNQADIILIGASRSGKTPTSLYLAIQFGIYAANYPLTEEDYMQGGLPVSLRPYKEKLFGLVITADRLQQIRHERFPASRYSSIEQCKSEVRYIQQLYFQENIPCLDTTHASIEEMATKILIASGIKKRLY